MTEHKPYFCESCQAFTITCGTCGNNTCNGGCGTLANGEECPDCESAYELYMSSSDKFLKDWFNDLKI